MAEPWKQQIKISLTVSSIKFHSLSINILHQWWKQLTPDFLLQYILFQNMLIPFINLVQLMIKPKMLRRSLKFIN